MLAFAAQYDPQSFHLDAAAAAGSVFGGLVASGLQTLAMVHGILVRSGVLDRIGGLAGLGMDQVRFLRPVRAGDCLHATMQTLSLRPSRGQPGRGIARHRVEADNQQAEKVVSYEASVLVRLENWAPLD